MRPNIVRLLIGFGLIVVGFFIQDIQRATLVCLAGVVILAWSWELKEGK